MKYVDKYVRNGVRIKKGVQETFEDIDISKKGKIRREICDKVGDRDSLIADNAKMLSLLICAVGRLYDVIPENITSNLSSQDKMLLEYVFSKKSQTPSSVDISFSKDPTGTIDKLFGRQADIYKIISEN